MGMSDQVGNELDEFVTDTLRNNLLGLPLDLADDQHDPGPLRGHPAAERAAPADLRRAPTTASSTPYTSWVDFGENLKHPESLDQLRGGLRHAPDHHRARRPLPRKRAAASDSSTRAAGAT